MSEVNRYTYKVDYDVSDILFCECADVIAEDKQVFVLASDYDAAKAELAALREDLVQAKSDRGCEQRACIEAHASLTAAEQRNAEWRELLRVMTSEYACCLEAGYDRITSLRGDCDSVAKMLADNTNYAKAVAALAKPTESGASNENAAWVAANPFWPCDNAEELAEFKAWQARKRAGESGESE